MSRPAVPYGLTNYVCVRQWGDTNGVFIDGHWWNISATIADTAFALEYAGLLANSGRTVMILTTHVQMFITPIAPDPNASELNSNIRRSPQ